MKKILIIDDQVEVRDLVEVTLRSGEYQVLQGASGMEAIEMARKERPDLIIMDVMMPGEIDGLEATRRIKADPETKGCTVLMLTGRSQSEDREKGTAAGADDYFIKPFSPLELIQKVEEVIR
jgi:CheY-like chemotaxis protein